MRMVMKDHGRILRSTCDSTMRRKSTSSRKNIVRYQVKDKVSQLFQNFFLPLQNVANVAASVLEIVQFPNNVS